MSEETTKEPTWFEKTLKTTDFIFNKLIPKKFIVWIVGTVLVFMGKIDGNAWVLITGAYLGLNFASKIPQAFIQVSKDKNDVKK